MLLLFGADLEAFCPVKELKRCVLGTLGGEEKM